MVFSEKNVALKGQNVYLSVYNTTSTYYYLFTDHLGSTVLMGSQNSAKNQLEAVTGSRATYYPFGDYRGLPPTQTLTDRGFTGQKSNNQPGADLGLLYYNARYYAPGIARFISADTIVPDPANPQAFNRYAYTLNNPGRYTDPSGYKTCDDMPWECNNDGAWFDDGSETPLPSIPPPSQLLPAYIPLTKFSVWPLDTNAPGYSNSWIQGFGDTNFAWKGRNSYYAQSGHLHSGIDIFVDSGASVMSLGVGRVVCVGCGARYEEGVTDQGIGIYHNTCNCVVYYVHLSSYAVQTNDLVETGTLIGASGVGFGVEHIHLEIRPSVGSATYYNPLYFFEPSLLIGLNLSFQSYHNIYDNPEWRIIGFTSKAGDMFYSYWAASPLPEIDVLFGRNRYLGG